MIMRKGIILYSFGFLLGTLLALSTAVYAANNNKMRAANIQLGENPMYSGEVCRGMEKMMIDPLQGKAGDAFDRAFIETMISHHQDAIDMAQEAKINAKHDELKIMADEIINTQSKEINQLKEWQRDWGYQ